MRMRKGARNAADWMRKKDSKCGGCGCGRETRNAADVDVERDSKYDGCGNGKGTRNAVDAESKRELGMRKILRESAGAGDDVVRRLTSGASDIRCVWPRACPGSTAASGKVIYKQIYTQVHQNLIQAFGTEMQHLTDAHAASYTAQEQRTDAVLAIAAQSGGSGRGPRPAAPARCDGGTQSGAEEFAIAIGNAVLFETFTNDTTKILWSQGFLSGTAAMWSSNITNAQSFGTTRFDFNTWLSEFRA
ncbi:hypothetical protein FIBSPDRAFT_943716, partial [Athelia psychrophila]